MKNQSCSTASASCDTKGCWQKLFKGALIGGLVMFAWISVSWMVLPWHKAGMRSFKNDAVVSAAVSANAAKPGIYMLSDQKMGKATKAIRKGRAVASPAKPFAFMSVVPNGFDAKKAMKHNLGWQFLLCFFSAMVLTALLKKGTCCGGCPIMFSALVGLVVGIAGHVPGWIWFHFPTNFTLIGIADDVIGFALAGSVIVCWICKDKVGKSAGSCSMK